ncbi:MAG: RluA family pseudouridine synthase [Bacteroidales bacterium]|jgi:23S rRNA pseudouridine1911/1915/1917 synthase|nr:RluA family pseudouridine synthase [Bacteroidales bacterium]NLK81181.1 RluA family pseudouridine synthase [Bacteroidales bacterium]
MNESNTKNILFQVLYEDNHLIAVSKTNNVLVQSDKTGDAPLEELVKMYIKKKYNKPGNVFLGVIHRIDRPVSGLVLFARTSKALTRMNELFKKQEITKIYWAIVKNTPPQTHAQLHHFISRNTKINKSQVYKTQIPNTKEALLTYTYKAASQKYHLLEINLHTGRHHQIRAQLSYIGSPIKGDLKYGAKRSNPNGGISLHARSVTFMHPVTKQHIHIVAPCPQDDALWQEFERSVL